MYENLPAEIKEKALCCLWKKEKHEGRMTKIAYQVNGHKVRANDRDTFTSFNSVIPNIGAYDGVGMGVFDGFSAVDIDNCVVNGKLTELAIDIIETMNSYTEYSPSGQGIRIIFKTDGLCYNKEKYYVNNRKLGLEIYVSDYTKKFVTLTGNAINNSGIGYRDRELLTVLEKYMVKPNVNQSIVKAVPGSYLSDDSVISKALMSSQGDKFSALWNGNIPEDKSHSEADQALCSILAFWCGGDTEQMDRLFRLSGLMRDKWGRDDYRTATLNNAVAITTEFYKPLPVSTPEEDFSDALAFLQSVKPETNSKYTLTDIGNGRLFADCYKAISRYVPERKLWYCYKDGVWSADIGSLRTMELCKELADALLIYITTIHDEHQREGMMKACHKWQTRRTRETILKDAQGIHPISLSKFGTDPYIFNCKNGTLHLNNMEFTEHNPEDLLTKISSVEYNPDATCHRFTEFINEVTSGDVDKALFLKKIMGYGISGDTRYESLFILYGATTRNGKGTLCESILRVLGAYGCTARPETISIKQNSNSQNPSEDIARLAGIRFANISEPGKGLVLNAAQVKSMTGNDTLNARFLHENSFDFKPQFKLYINTNYLPVINDMTLFSSGRVIIIPFERHFDESEQDKSLKSEFAKPENQSAILNWLLEGYQRLKQEGLCLPDSVAAATAAYQRDSDKIKQFAEDNLVADPRAEERTSMVYASYKSWCFDNGYRAESMKTFKQGLMTMGSVVRRRPRNGGSETTLLEGYRLVSDFLT